MAEFGDTKRLSDIAEGVLRDDSVLRFAENETDTRLIVGMAQHVIDSREVEVHLARVLRFELAHLQIDHDEASELQVVKEQIELEILSSDFKRNLAPDEGEADAQLDEKLAQMCEEFPFQVALLCLLGEGEEVEVVWVFEDLLGEIGLRRRKRSLEIRDGPSLPPIEPAFNLEHEDVSAPAVLDRLLDVPEALHSILHLVEQDAIVEPRQLCSSLLHNCFVRPGFR